MSRLSLGSANGLGEATSPFGVGVPREAIASRGSFSSTPELVRSVTAFSSSATIAPTSVPPSFNVIVT
jgi:hypothetical protein